MTGREKSIIVIYLKMYYERYFMFYRNKKS